MAKQSPTIRPRTLYTKAIMEWQKVGVDDAHLIENLMRLNCGGTLDHLDATEFHKVASEAKTLLACDHKLRKLIDEEVFPRTKNCPTGFGRQEEI